MKNKAHQDMTNPSTNTNSCPLWLPATCK